VAVSQHTGREALCWNTCRCINSKWRCVVKQGTATLLVKCLRVMHILSRRQRHKNRVACKHLLLKLCCLTLLSSGEYIIQRERIKISIRLMKAAKFVCLFCTSAKCCDKACDQRKVKGQYELPSGINVSSHASSFTSSNCLSSRWR